jgi:hypothetical protein
VGHRGDRDGERGREVHAALRRSVLQLLLPELETEADVSEEDEERERAGRVVLLGGAGCIGTKSAETPEAEATEAEASPGPASAPMSVAELKDGMKYGGIKLNQQVMVLAVADRSGGEQLVIFEEGLAANIVDSKVGKIRQGQRLYVAGFYKGYIKVIGERYIYISDAVLLPETILDPETPDDPADESTDEPETAPDATAADPSLIPMLPE